MTTQLERFSDAYASVHVALYEPLVLRWVSRLQIGLLAAHLVRQAHGRGPPAPGSREGARPVRPGSVQWRLESGETVDNLRREFKKAGDKIQLSQLDQAIETVKQRSVVDVAPLEIVRLLAISDRQPATSALGELVHSGSLPAPGALATILSPNVVAGLPRAAKEQAQMLRASMLDAAGGWSAGGDGQLASVLAHAAKDFSVDLSNLAGQLEEALSPIGLVRSYRQLFFHIEEGVGPIEQAFTVAPLESLEIIYESTRRQVHEEEVEIGNESISEAAVDEKNTDEISDKVSAMMQRDLSVGVSATAGGGIGFVYGSGSATFNFALQSQDAREQISKRVTEVTKRASERMRRTFTMRTRDTTEITQREFTRRVIRNEALEPVSYGLRRVLKKVRVKVQELGPSLVWQVNVASPGDRLATSRYLQFTPQDRIEVPGMATPPRGGTGRSTTVADVGSGAPGELGSITIAVSLPASQRLTAVTIERLSDVGGTQDDDEPAIVGGGPTRLVHNDSTNTTTATFSIRRGNRRSISVEYGYIYEPSPHALAEHEAQMRRAEEAGAEQVVARGLERARLLITERSKILSRPSADLRREERYEILSRIVAELGEDGGADTTPLEIELFNRYFDVDNLFYTVHPGWWRPRWQSPDELGYGRPDYQVTADSAPAAMGSSLGWALQLDGDARRNEFLNAPFVRACLPIRHGRERDALDWLARRIEGDVGYWDAHGKMSQMLDEVEQFRDRERLTPAPGYDYVELLSNPGTGAGGGAVAEDVYPIINEFDVVVPTDGFVYDRIAIST